MPIDPNQLAAWRKLCEEASFAPWTCRGHEEFDVRSLVYSIDGPNEPVILADGCCTEPDAAFIATARTALPQLLDEVEALQRRVAELGIFCERSRRVGVIEGAERTDLHWRQGGRHHDCRDSWRAGAAGHRGPPGRADPPPRGL